MSNEWQMGKAGIMENFVLQMARKDAEIENLKATIKEVKKRLSTSLVSNSAHDLRSAIQDAWEALVESEGGD